MDGEERPRPRNALELVFAAKGKLEAGTSHEVRDGARGEHLAGLRECSDAGRDVHCDAAEPVTALFAFTGMDAGTQLNTESPGRISRGEGALHGASWSIERSEESIDDYPSRQIFAATMRR